MRKPILLLLAVVLVAVSVSEVYAKDPEEMLRKQVEEFKKSLGKIIGKIEIFPGVACSDCFVKITDWPAPPAHCDNIGRFYFPEIPASFPYLLYIYSKKSPNKTLYSFQVAVHPQWTTDVGIIVLPTGMIAGRINGVDAWNLAKMVITVEGIPLATKPDAYGNYLLTNVPMGQRQIVLHGIWWDKSQPVGKMQINVPENQLTNAPDFVLKLPPPPAQLQQPPQPPGHMRPEPHPLPPAKVEPSPSMPAPSPQSSGRDAAPPRPEQEARPHSTKMGYCCLHGQVTHIPLEECERKAGSIFPTLEEANRNCKGGGRTQ